MDALKKLLVSFTESKPVKALVCIFPSLYLTLYVYLYMLDSVWLCLFLLGFFFVVCRFFSHIAGRLFKVLPQPETALLSIAVAVMVLAEGWHVFFPLGDACSPLTLLLYGSGILSIIGFLCFCGFCALFGKKEEQGKNEEIAEKTSEKAEVNGETCDIYVSDYVEKLKRINIWENVCGCLKKRIEETGRYIMKLAAKLKVMLVAVLSYLDRWLVAYAFLFSCMLVAGGKMNLGGNPYFQPMVFGDIWRIAVLFGLSLVIGSILKMINGKCSMEMQTRGISKGWWLGAWLFLVVLWCPYLLAYYPGTLSLDSFASLDQVKDLGTLYNHIPVAYTLLIAFFVRAGWEIGDANFGVFLFSFFQMVVMAGVLSYSACWVRKKVRSRAAAIGTLLFYGLNPIVALYSITMWKDVLFSAWIVLLCLFLFDMAGDGGRELREKKNLLRLGLLFILIAFARNNGVYVVFLCWVVVLLSYKYVRKKLLLFGGIVILSVVLIQGPGYQLLGIAQAGFAESVGIPLQQICYTVVTDGPLEEKEEEFLGKIIPIETIKESYSPISVDHIKFNKEFNRVFFEENKAVFMELYFRLFASHPRAYVQAYLLSTSGFWHIEPSVLLAEERTNENDMGIFNVDYLKKYFGVNWKGIVSGMLTFLMKTPFTNVGLMVWLVFFYVAVSLSQKQTGKVFLAVPMIGCWVTLMIATPVNAQFRYVYYYYLMLPIVCIIFFIKRDSHAGQVPSNS